MDVSTRKVLERTLSITKTHPESDQTGDINEKIGDVSVNYKGYTKYDEVDVVTDSSISEDEKIKIRHTHLYIQKNINEEIKSITEYYIENKLGPFESCFTEDSVPIINIQPIPDSSIENL